MNQAVTARGTVARAFHRSSEADDAVKRLRAAGFADVRVSERAGETTKAHVMDEAGRTASDFVLTLERAGFSAADARALTDAVASGGVLVTVIAADRVREAEAVFRGETIAARSIGPVDEQTPWPAAPPPAPVAQAPAVTPAPALADGDQVVPVRAEQLEIERRPTTSEARVRKETVTEQQTITVPVKREQLVVERDGHDPVRIPIDDDRDANRGA